jgi:hypothetical protein
MNRKLSLDEITGAMANKKLELRDPDERPSILDAKLARAGAGRDGREPEPREPERD